MTALAEADADRRARAAAPPVNAVEITGLTKVYGRGRARPALDAVDLVIPRGSRFALLGPNGAGKSTLINILAGLVIKTSGTARIWDIDIDRDPRRARTAIGVVPQELNLDPFFTPYESLELQAGLYGVPRRERHTEEILAALALTDQKDAYARSMSGGMRRRLLVAKAMVHDPPVLVLDEPTAGVDIELRQQLWAYVRSLNARGTTILLTTHYLEEAEELCEHIAIIDHGRVIACEAKETLLARLDHKEMTITTAEPVAALPPGLEHVNGEVVAPRRIRVRYHRSGGVAGRILAAVRDAGLTIVDLSTSESDLEDIFLQLTKGTHGTRTGPPEDG